LAYAKLVTHVLFLVVLGSAEVLSSGLSFTPPFVFNSLMLFDLLKGETKGIPI
jgi:hypothetical protein